MSQGISNNEALELWRLAQALERADRRPCDLRPEITALVAFLRQYELTSGHRQPSHVHADDGLCVSVLITPTARDAVVSSWFGLQVDAAGAEGFSHVTFTAQRVRK